MERILSSALVLALAVPAAAQDLDKSVQAELAAFRVSFAAAISSQKAAAQGELTSDQARALIKAKLAGSGVPDSYVDVVFADPRAKLGLRDDAALLSLAGNPNIVVTTDLLTDGVMFDAGRNDMILFRMAFESAEDRPIITLGAARRKNNFFRRPCSEQIGDALPCLVNDITRFPAKRMSR